LISVLKLIYIYPVFDIESTLYYTFCDVASDELATEELSLLSPEEPPLLKSFSLIQVIVYIYVLLSRSLVFVSYRISLTLRVTLL
jgi:hypothetical protein